MAEREKQADKCRIDENRSKQRDCDLEKRAYPPGTIDPGGLHVLPAEVLQPVKTKR